MSHSVFRRMLLKFVLSLPSAILRLMCGGGVVHIEGRTLDTQIQFLWMSYLRENGVELLSIGDKPLEQVRHEWQDIASLLGGASFTGMRIDTIDANCPMSATLDGSLPFGGILIRPQFIDPNMPLLLFFHEGCGVLGGAELSQSFASILAEFAACPIFIPHYRLAPDHRYPAALDDARLCLEWAMRNAHRLGSDIGEIAIGGQSMGANLATRLCLDLKREFKPMPVAQMLISPLLDLSDDTLGNNPYANIWPLRAPDFQTMIHAYAGSTLALNDPRLSPLLETVIIGQPKSLVVCGGLDIVADQAQAYVARLNDSRTPVTYRRYDTLPHAFGLFASVVDEARSATIDIAREWAALLQR